MSSKLTSEILDDETLAELIAFRRSRVEYCPKEGLPYQKALHDSMMLALEELQECRKADSEPVATLDVQSGRPDGHKFSLAYSSVAHKLPDDVYFLYRHAQQPVVPDAYVRDERGRMMLNGVCEPKIGFSAGWNACRAAMLQSSCSIQPAPALDFEPKTAEARSGNSPVIPDGLIAAVNRLLDSDGSRGCYSAIRCRDARAEVERLLATAPQEVPDGK